ncbi:ABC transporter permease subunit [Kitasatospora camelliae]|uniref:ABC transporter permease subunit n=1 Tax=Kitasatospora camelliae TaxID=3156397 RepID=A0AAU8JPZ0_9ACTN
MTTPRRPSSGAALRRRGLALAFLLPALALLGALVLYPIGWSVVRSLFDADGTGFVGLGNYQAVLADDANLTALRNSAIWVAVAPALVTAIGLVFAVLTEKVRWGTAFKLLVFMPMAISFLAAGITFRLVYEQDPQRGVLNAAAVAVHDTFDPEVGYPGARPRPTGGPALQPDGSVRAEGGGGPAAVLVPLVGLKPDALPATAAPAATPSGDGVHGVVYLDVSPGGGTPGRIDAGERGLPGVRVELHDGGRTVATTVTADDGGFRFAGHPTGTVSLPAGNFAAPYRGLAWLGPGLVTPAIIGAYIWIWAGFAMVIIAGGLANLPRETLEAARMDGAGEWQIFRRITVPQLAPVLGVVFVTMVINVMKIFDLVFVIAPGPVQQDSGVLALRLWLVSFGGGNDQGLGSALGVLLLLLVVPAMVLNIRRFRRSPR